jgi:hypothetical protein
VAQRPGFDPTIEGVAVHSARCRPQLSTFFDRGRRFVSESLGAIGQYSVRIGDEATIGKYDFMVIAYYSDKLSVH